MLRLHVAEYYLGENIKEDAMGWARGINEGEEKCIQILGVGEV